MVGRDRLSAETLVLGQEVSGGNSLGSLKKCFSSVDMVGDWICLSIVSGGGRVQLNREVKLLRWAERRAERRYKLTVSAASLEASCFSTFAHDACTTL